jgi:hypothetical protein
MASSLSKEQKRATVAEERTINLGIEELSSCYNIISRGVD